MVLIGASVITKAGKPLFARIFISDMTKARLEGLLDAFPKLIASEKCEFFAQRQHTFVETDSVRYVFHPLDNVYMVLITTKASNILEDLETLRLFSRVIPEYCRSNDEKEILSNVYDLIFAFDEIVALGYRENVNLAQIRTFTEMDSHEERVFNQIKIAQERAATEVMTQKANELKKLKAEQKKAMRGIALSGMGIATAISSSTPTSVPIEDSTVRHAPKSVIPSSRGGGKALKLGSRTADEDQFLNQLKIAGTKISSDDYVGATTASRLPVHLKLEEKINAVVSRDGGLESFEIIGSASLLLSDPEFNNIAIQMVNGDKYGAQLQVHPNLDRKEWQQNSLLRLKSAQKPFPVNVDVGVLKWRLQLTNEESLPVSINCWPSENPDGCVVNIEYTLQAEHMTLNNVLITIPLPPATVPVIAECEGSYEYIKSKSQLLWSLAVIDGSNNCGTLEFNTPNGRTDHFFPINLRFWSADLFLHKMTSNDAMQYSCESRLITEKFEIV
ncbi:unnamed protein product [Dracunculus medinensis]|uniref:Coatomer subunit delta n=1 Tax=Dracunculus medinensis TaxID=318479 RepID=A0A0N4U266_DRAME|nr:unnamed protein product [Dracunculus medinensis]